MYKVYNIKKDLCALQVFGSVAQVRGRIFALLI